MYFTSGWYARKGYAADVYPVTSAGWASDAIGFQIGTAVTGSCSPIPAMSSLFLRTSPYRIFPASQIRIPDDRHLDAPRCPASEGYMALMRALPRIQYFPFIVQI